MKIDWYALDRAMERRIPSFWWRDDDAVAPGTALDRLIENAARIGAPLTLASIPANATPALATRIDRADAVDVAVHGWSHTNHAPTDEKKAEFGAHRPLTARIAEAEQGKARLQDLFGRYALPVFIPPWNRIAPDMPAALAASGFWGLSVYGERRQRLAPLPRFDSHLDPIDWRGTRSAVDPATLIAQVVTLLEDAAPIGLMTHHLVHDDAIWQLVEALTERVTARGARWVSLASLIARAEAPTV